MAYEQIETAADAALEAPEAEAVPASPDTTTAPADGNAMPDADALQARVQELEAERERLVAEKAERDRADAVVTIARRFPYLSEEIVQALPEDLPTDRLEAVAGALNRAMDTALHPLDIGRGGLDPTQHRGATWDGLFRNAL